MFEVGDRVVLIAGGTRGIGRAMAAAFARAGASVVLTSRSAESAEAAARAIAGETGGAVEGRACDSADAAACAALVESIVEARGRLDVLINNAGITNDKLLLRMSEEDWRSVFETNLHGAFFLTKAAVRPMIKRRWGRIINVASVVGIIGNAGQTNYAATKAGLIGFTKSLARELGSRGVTVNAIAPGYIETAMTDAIAEEMKVKMAAQIPLGRLGRPEDVAAAALFLASPAADYITGEVLKVDGGLAM
jgi:3-oxoacyl-[acyl-carrier protein] reductase